MSKIRGLITPKEAKKLNDAFTERCELISKDITKRPDNRSSWYSLEDIKTYFFAVEIYAGPVADEYCRLTFVDDLWQPAAFEVFGNKSIDRAGI